MSDEALLLDRTGPAFTLTLNRPDKRNAVTAAMWRRLPELLAEVKAAPQAKALIVTGAGGAFAAGADIGEFEAVYATPESSAAYSAAIAAALDGLAAFPKPAIAKIRGACVGGGCGIALACDVRFAAEGARFGITPGKLGLTYPLNDTKRLVDAVGVATAKDILFSGRLLDGAEALRVGLINHLTSEADLDGAVADYAGQIASTSQFSARTAKKMVALIQAGAVSDTEETRRWFLEAFSGADFAEGYRAFLEKRPPKFPSA
ncbi:MAG: enoyl-CoA hydratase-related protein [Caulobacterales bacterium]|nr:enoyl-CoA hydratase-related protein [Caulobacterales bacterium]